MKARFYKDLISSIDVHKFTPYARIQNNLNENENSFQKSIDKFSMSRLE